MRSRRLLPALLLAVAVVAGCKSSSQRPPDGSATSDAGITGVDTGGVLAPCVDTPSDLPRPPAGRLPCDLIPPGLSL